MYASARCVAGYAKIGQLIRWSLSVIMSGWCPTAKSGARSSGLRSDSACSAGSSPAPQLAEDVILANPDQALIVFAITQPEPHLRMLDRFLVVAEFAEIPAIICVNKVDLSTLDHAHAIFELYERIGYRVIYASAEENLGIDELEELLADRITVVAGPSGVGKSSLLNAIHPDLHLETGDLRDFLNKGKHTTRQAHLISLPFGERTFVADTPGIRELGLYDIDPADMGFYFIEMDRLPARLPLPELHPRSRTRLRCACRGRGRQDRS